MSVTHPYLRREESVFSSQTFVGHQKCCTLTAVTSSSNLNRTGVTSLTFFKGTLLQTVHYITSNEGLFTFWSKLAMHSLCLRNGVNIWSAYKFQPSNFIQVFTEVKIGYLSNLLQNLFCNAMYWRPAWTCWAELANDPWQLKRSDADNVILFKMFPSKKFTMWKQPVSLKHNKSVFTTLTY